MSVMKYVKDKIDGFEDGKVFDYYSFNIDRSKMMALSKALSRLFKSGKIKRLKRGLYYKTKKTKYGELMPDEKEVLKNILYKNKKRIGYLTGVKLYNRLGLTAQIANEYQIAVNKLKKDIKMKKVKVNFTKVNAPINEKNYRMLQYLDVLKNIKNIPGSSKNTAYKKIKNIILNLKTKEINRIIELADYYRAGTNALLGTILQDKTNINLKKLKKRLSPFSNYKFNIENIKNKKKWMIS
ncbi:MAG: hypothetical protein FXF47_06490 [Candidatus Mcinerneyibacterium aminivorans]|uniref:AbiEi antitoxin C-terminal domain-containing protein n=1 Tax=Candidatus Mcinerneyibacterium aminivorans TaxID=2703815 RepID=A0A5D0MH79_9BACT|nr:MAG: hypothetical protein FXF47_06490 [Candidatus Mcinerneyibacterium aminivorans]